MDWVALRNLLTILVILAVGIPLHRMFIRRRNAWFERRRKPEEYVVVRRDEIEDLRNKK
jgi:hypothetical protein